MHKNKQLADIDVQDAKRKLRENLPLSLKELACALEVGYDTALAWRREEDFPYDFGKVFPSDFECWRRKRLGVQRSRAVSSRHQNMPNAASSVPLGMSSTLPRKAVLIAARAGL